MVVTLGALESGAEENGARGVHAIDDLIDAILLRMHAGFDIAGRRAVETSGNALGGGGVGQEIAGDLLNDKLVERHALVKSINDVIAVCPTIAKLVGLKSVAVGVTREVQPRAGPAFAVARAI